MKPRDTYMFVIDTDSYAGNFERELCAYITDRVDEITSSDAELQAEIALEEMPEIVEEFEDIMIEIQVEPDDYPKFVACWPTPGYGNDGMGKIAKLTPENKADYPYDANLSVAIFFSERPSDKLITIMKERAQHLATAGIPWYSNTRKRVVSITKFRLLRQNVDYLELTD